MVPVLSSGCGSGALTARKAIARRLVDSAADGTLYK